MLLKLYIPSLIILLIVFLICKIKEIPIEVMLSDPLALVDAYPWLGLVSNLGILVWTGCVGVCFFYSGGVITEKPRKGIRRLSCDRRDDHRGTDAG